MKLNRKGYLTVEIILASTIAFAIAFFLIEITVKLVSKTDDVYHETVIAYDDAIIINNIKEKIKDMFRLNKKESSKIRRNTLKRQKNISKPKEKLLNLRIMQMT